LILDTREQLQKATTRTDAESLAAAVAATRRGEPEGRLQLAAALAWVAYSCPGATEAVYDNIMSGWLGHGPTPEIPTDLAEAPLTSSFWAAFWPVVQGPEGGYDAITVTVAVAGLRHEVHPDFEAISEAYARTHPGAAASLTNPVPGQTDFEALAKCPAHSLGWSLHKMIVENGYDPEVLDRESIKLAALPPTLQYLNTRILQMHDVWHLVAGYETTSSNEIAISAFQLAQFPHDYSAMFLAAGLAMSIEHEPRGFNIIMQIVAEAWQHGRESPAMMDIEWEREWNHSLQDIRGNYGIRTYDSVFPTDLLEMIEGTSMLKKLKALYLILQYHFRLQRRPALST
jgi:ubiquinone biosynthesis protein Coq4